MMAEKVPEKLLQELHQANQRFGAARREREAAVDEPVMESTHLEQAEGELRAAEKDLEQVNAKIKSVLHGKPRQDEKTKKKGKKPKGQ